MGRPGKRKEVKMSGAWIRRSSQEFNYLILGVEGCYARVTGQDGLMIGRRGVGLRSRV